MFKQLKHLEAVAVPVIAPRGVVSEPTWRLRSVEGVIVGRAPYHARLSVRVLSASGSDSLSQEYQEVQKFKARSDSNVATPGGLTGTTELFPLNQ